MSLQRLPLNLDRVESFDAGFRKRSQAEWSGVRRRSDWSQPGSRHVNLRKVQHGARLDVGVSIGAGSVRIEPMHRRCILETIFQSNGL